MKRVVICAGHFGSGKTTLAVSLSKKLRNEGKEVTLCDMDIINPFFRAKDAQEELSKIGVEVLSSENANSSFDALTLPAVMHKICEENDKSFVLDVGGDDTGAVALGTLKKDGLSYEMLFVVNFFRPKTPDAKSAFSVLKSIENACGLKFTSIVNNSSLGSVTTREDVLKTLSIADELCEISGLPLKYTCLKEPLYFKIKDEVPSSYCL